jgi:signal transduction histidine kinase
VEISTAVVGDHVLIRIQDDGPGIAPDIQEKIFDLYFSTKESDGTGLGLPYAERIVKDHNGSLSVESEMGKGSIFTISLPLGIITGSQS